VAALQLIAGEAAKLLDDFGPKRINSTYAAGVVALAYETSRELDREFQQCSIEFLSSRQSPQLNDQRRAA
jgi:hypothetical protein